MRFERKLFLPWLYLPVGTNARHGNVGGPLVASGGTKSDASRCSRSVHLSPGASANERRRNRWWRRYTRLVQG